MWSVVQDDHATLDGQAQRLGARVNVELVHRSIIICASPPDGRAAPACNLVDQDALQVLSPTGTYRVTAHNVTFCAASHCSVLHYGALPSPLLGAFAATGKHWTLSFDTTPLWIMHPNTALFLQSRPLPAPLYRLPVVGALLSARFPRDGEVVVRVRLVDRSVFSRHGWNTQAYPEFYGAVAT